MTDEQEMMEEPDPDDIADGSDNEGDPDDEDLYQDDDSEEDE